MVENKGSGVTQSRFEYSLYVLLVGWPLTSCVTSLNFSFLIFKMGLIIQRVIGWIKRYNLCYVYDCQSLIDSFIQQNT